MIYKKKKLEFKIPEWVEQYIDEFVEYMNSEGDHSLRDCYETEVECSLHCDDDGLSPEQKQEIRDYYVFGGIDHTEDE